MRAKWQKVQGVALAAALMLGIPCRVSGQDPLKEPLMLKGGLSKLSLPGEASADQQTHQLRLQRPKLDASVSAAPPPKFTLEASQFRAFGLTDTQAKALAHYNLEIIIDRSKSMRRRDCPGGMSRWDWCAYQAADIAKSLTPYVPNGMTITRFAGGYDTHEHATTANLVDILQAEDFELGTRLAEPLAARLENFFARRKPGDKPLLIAVITDGRPWPRYEPYMVMDTLVRASRCMRGPKDVTVVFLQIGGDDPKGQAYLLDLSSNLVGYGARYQYVRTKTFDELQAVGLARALEDAVTH